MDIAFSRLNQLAFGYWHAQTLFTLSESGVFDHVATQSKSAAELATLLRLEPDAGEALLDAGVALGLLLKQDGRYAPTELSVRFLVSSSPESLSQWVRVMGRWFSPWSGLKRSLELGHPAEPQAPRLIEDPAYLETFIVGMHEYASRASDAVAEVVELPNPSHLVDVGGGAGTYSIALCRKYPNLTAEIVDQSPVLAISNRTIAEAGLSHRISATAGDYRSASFGTGADAILFSNVLHQESQTIGVAMLKRAYAALKDGGRVIVHGHFLANDRVSPVFVTLHNLSARVLWEGGHSYTSADMQTFIAEANFVDVDILPIPRSATTVLIGHKRQNATK